MLRPGADVCLGLLNAPGSIGSLSDIVITRCLHDRPGREPDYRGEADCFVALAGALTDSPETILQHLVDSALRLCRAGTAGISLLEEAKGETVFRWVAVAGKLKAQAGGCSPREHSPCGTTLARGCPQLFFYPGNHFTYLAAADPPIIEGLVVPVYHGEETLGTLWAASHDEGRQFDREDMRLLSRLGSFIAATLKSVSASKTARRAAQHAQLLSSLSQEIGLMAEPDEIIRTACQAIGRQFEASRCYFYVVDETGRRVTVKADWCADGLASLAGERVTTDPDQAQLWRIMSLEQVAISEIALHPLTRNLADYYSKLGITSYATTPFFRVGKSTVVLGVSTPLPRVWMKDEQVLLENLVARIWPVVERAWSDRQLRESEKRHRELLSGLPIACYTLDTKGRVDFFNKAAIELWGRTPALGEELWCGSHRIITLDGKELSADACPAAIAMKERRPIRGIEAFVERPDGSRRRIVAHPTPLFDRDGQCIGLINVIADVTDERAAQESLRQNEAFLQSVVGATSDCIKVLNPAGELQWMNENAYRLLAAHDLAQFAGTPWTSLWPESARESVLAALAAARANQVGRFRGFRPTADGLPKWWDVILTAIVGQDGRPERFLSVSRDITEQYEAEIALKDSRAKLEAYAIDLERHVSERTLTLQQTVAELESFSYSISHDMRAPLRAMQSFAHLLRDECGDQINADGRDYIRRIVNAAARMDRLIQDILVYSRMARNEVPLSPVDLVRLLDEILESYPQFARPQAQIQVSRPIPPVWGNEAALTQCFSNLIDNAVKFVPAGTVPDVRIWAETQGDLVRIYVKDNGIGIEPRFQEKIFGIFYQHDQKYPGTGIGLAVVRKAAERMGGRIGLSSELGSGSTFYLEVKRAG